METFDHCNTDAAASLEAGQKIQAIQQEVQTLGADFLNDAISVPFTIDTDGKAQSLEHLLKKPFRHKANPNFLDAYSFIQYVKLYSTAGTIIFSKIDTKGGSFSAALDLAPKGETSWNDHSATFTLEQTPDWKVWIENNKKWMKQDEFVQFVETQRHVFRDPSSATMLEIAMSIEATIGGAYKSAFRNDNGDRTLVLDMSTNASYGKSEAKIAVPQEITILIAPFEGQNAYEQAAFLRFRPMPDGVKFQYELQRPEEVIRTSAEEARTRIAAETGKLVLNGAFASRQGL